MIGTDWTGTLALGNTGAGVLVDAGSTSNTVGGPVGGARNVISGNAVGVEITGAATSGTDIAGNLIGTDITGAVPVPNTSAGVSIAGAAGTTIGGATVLAQNVISGNSGDGIDLGGGATNTLIQGNYIGIDQTGSQRVGNQGVGISVTTVTGVTIGGTVHGDDNVISANVGSGVSISGASGTGIIVLGNFIGTDYTGKSALGNGADGIAVSDPRGVTIGGTVSGSANIISANAGAGIALLDDADDELIEGNLIGTDITGSNPLGNGIGILVDGGSSDNTIGGTVAGAGNTIAFSAGAGVNVDPTGGTGNAIRLNSIFSNTGLGIELGTGVTTNPPGGPHTGPNDLQNYPVITALTTGGGTTTISGTLNSTPSTTFALDFFALSVINASRYGEGRYVLGSDPVTTNAAGNASFTFSFPTPAQGATYVSTTATDPNGNTSEFSLAFGTDLKPTAIIGFTSLTVDEGVPVPFDGSASLDPEGGGLTYDWSFTDGTMLTGEEVVHRFLEVGTFTVTLTVSDGFGGSSSAMATIMVLDVPPSFVPQSFTPPQTFTARAPGDGFGTSVASVAGNAAVGDPFDNGSGAVFLYDGDSSDNGVYTQYTYGQLIHTFADPHQAAGDEFGASIATVGNDLLIGAPGSSLTGPGDGVAYLFDADPSDPDFGVLLATFTLPDPDPAGEAHFGAAVAAANTNAIIAAPGKDGGTGEVFLFAGDPTQLNFGTLLLDITNPDLQAGSQFGAAVAGIGSDVIAGAPSDNTAGPGAGIVYVFSGTTGAEEVAIENPHPLTSTGFGSAVGSVGPNVLIGSPNDNSEAGAAFLYGYVPATPPSPPTLLETFIQPDGGGGHFGASVAGLGTTALIGTQRVRPSAPATQERPTSSTRIHRARRSACRSRRCKSPRPSPATTSAARSGSSTSMAVC